MEMEVCVVMRSMVLKVKEEVCFVCLVCVGARFDPLIDFSLFDLLGYLNGFLRFTIDS